MSNASRYFLFLFTRPRYSLVQLFLRRTLVHKIFTEHYRPQSADQHPKKNRLIIIAVFLFCSCVTFAQADLTIHFIHKANGKIIIQNDSVYYNSFGEPYTISKLKYYVSNIGGAKPNVTLVNAFGEDSLHIKIKQGTYNSISFLLGVDSLHNSSGAQDGALDPLNDMFWTWNSGYVGFKLEGNSDSSIADLKRLEHHIGGYKGRYKTMRMIELPLPKPFTIKNKEQYNIVIKADLDKYWNSINKMSIRQHPVIVVAGELAALSADNLQQLFSIEDVY